MEANDVSVEAFQRVAIKILKAQRKLGKLRGISVKVLSLDESRKNRLRKAGLITTALISASVLGFGVRKADQAGKFDKLGTATGKALRKGYDSKVGQKVVGGYRAVSQSAQARMQAARNSKFSQGVSNFASQAKTQVGNHKKAVGIGAGVAGAVGAGTLAYKAMQKQSIVIEAKYAYGSKMFEVSHVSQEEARSGIDRQILKEVNNQIGKLRNQDWVVKESVSESFYYTMMENELLLESVIEDCEVV